MPEPDFSTYSGLPTSSRSTGPTTPSGPGQYPYTRGPYAAMYRSKLWTMRMFAGLRHRGRHQPALQGPARRRRRRPLDRVRPADADGPRLRRPARAGRGRQVRRRGRHARRHRGPLPRHRPRRGHHVDDDQLARAGRASRCTSPRRSDRASTRAQLGGTLQNDILKEYQAQKEFVFPPAAEHAARARRDPLLPRPRCRAGTRSRSPATTSAKPARRPRRSSRSPSATASRTSRPRSRPGLDIDAFAPRLSFFFNAHIDFFEEIAKYRAARRIWARWMRDRYGAKRERSLQLRFHTQTAGVSLTAQQPEVNIVRTAIEALAGVLGGTQSLHTNSFDEALALPTEKAARLALRTQQVIAHETRVDQRRRPARRLVVRRGAHRRDGAPGRGDLRPHRRAGRRLDARGRARRHRGGLVPGRDRRGRLRRSSASSTTAATRWSASPRSPRATTSRRPTSSQIGRECEEQQLKRLAAVKADRDGDARRRARWPGCAPTRPTPTVNLMPALLDAVARVRDRRRDRWTRWPTCSAATARCRSSNGVDVGVLHPGAMGAALGAALVGQRARGPLGLGRPQRRDARAGDKADGLTMRRPGRGRGAQRRRDLDLPARARG